MGLGILCLLALPAPQENAAGPKSQPVRIAVAQFTAASPGSSMCPSWGEQLTHRVILELRRGHLAAERVAADFFSGAPLSPEQRAHLRSATTAEVLIGGQFTVSADQVHLNLVQIDIPTGAHPLPDISVLLGIRPGMIWPRPWLPGYTGG